jgi:hypothetical protein
MGCKTALARHRILTPHRAGWDRSFGDVRAVEKQFRTAVCRPASPSEALLAHEGEGGLLELSLCQGASGGSQPVLVTPGVVLRQDQRCKVRVVAGARGGCRQQGSLSVLLGSDV